MKKSKIVSQTVSLILFAPFIISAQNSGIQFTEVSNWNKVLERAKAEHKNIFVDCFATWCGPCRQMDNSIYPLKTAGENINDKFISIKVQIDTTSHDDIHIQEWYSDAQEIKRLYNVTVLPTFLFFSPDGTPLHKGIGFKTADQFILMAADALNPEKQFYTLMDNYRQGEKTYPAISDLGVMAYKLSEYKTADTIIADYVHNYLDTLNGEALFTAQNLNFMIYNIKNSSDKSFKFYYDNARKIDSLMDDGKFAENLIDGIIYTENINPKMFNGDKPVSDQPDWDKIVYGVEKKYNRDYADRALLNAKINWYNYKKDWAKLIKYNIDKFDKYGIDTTGLGRINLNNFAYNNIFMYAENSQELKKAIQWMEVILSIDINDANNMSETV